MVYFSQAHASTIESASKVNGVIAIDAEGSVDVKSCTFSDYTDVEDEYESALSLIHIFYFSGTLGEKEKEEVENWISLSEENRKIAKQI